MKLQAIKHLQKAETLEADKIHVLSHELRTPLAVISGYAQVLKEELVSEQAELVAPILENVSRLDQVISTLLEWESLTSTAPAAASNVDLCSVIERVADQYISTAAAKGIQIEIDHQESKIACYASAEVIESSLTQVIHNAIKFSSKGIVRIRTRFTSTRIEIRVEDEGTGLPINQTDLFQPFVQGSSGLSRTFEGLGLGLSLAQTHLSRISGEISLENGPVCGAIARLTFPRFASSATRSITKKLAA